MSSLSSVEAKLPPGFRFHPRDEELICDYLMKWMSGCPNNTPSLIEVDLNKCEPWDIPESACVGGNIWYFYSQRDRKYATGSRKNRATVSGYWKATGKDRPVVRKGTLVGMRKTLVFHQGRAPKGTKTDWVMHEFRLEGIVGPSPNTFNSVQEDWVLCRVLNKKRSEVKQETPSTGCSTYYPNINDTSSSINDEASLMEPYNNNNNIAYFDSEQVPCFSIYTTTQNQTWPNFSHIDPSSQLVLPGNY